MKRRKHGKYAQLNRAFFHVEPWASLKDRPYRLYQVSLFELVRTPIEGGRVHPVKRLAHYTQDGTE